MRSRRMFFLEIASERTSTKRSAAASVAALSSLKSRKPTESIDIYLYIYTRSIDRQNGEIRIRESVEKEISILTWRNGYAAVNRLVAPPPHKYSIKFIRTNISSSRPTRNLITIYGHVLYPVTDSTLRRYPPPTEIPNRSNSIRFCLRIYPDPSNPNSLRKNRK